MKHPSNKGKKVWPKRRIMREVVFKTTFSRDMNAGIENPGRTDNLIRTLFSEEDIYDGPLIDSAKEYYAAISEKVGEIDEIIKRYLFNWSWERLALVDKTILRLGTYELLYQMTVPIEVTLNESVELAKKYGTEKSGKFVNGVLDSIARELVPREKLKL